MTASRLASGLRSARLTLVLLLALAAVAVFGALPKGGRGGPATFGSPLFLSLVALLAVNIVVCTVHRFVGAGARRRGMLPDLVLHASLVLVIAGGASKAAFGVVRTAAVHVGTETLTAYDWGLDADVPLGFALRVQGLDVGHYPFRALVGAANAGTGRKLGLVEVGEGIAPAPAGDAVSVGFVAVDRESKRLSLRVATPAGPGLVSLEIASGSGATQRHGGVEFTLVAFRDEVKSVSARLRVVGGDGTQRETRLSTNDTLAVGGTRVCLTAWGKDEFGNPYAGFQVTRDPAAPVFWAGCILLACSIPAHYLARARRRRAG